MDKNVSKLIGNICQKQKINIVLFDQNCHIDLFLLGVYSCHEIIDQYARLCKENNSHCSCNGFKININELMSLLFLFFSAHDIKYFTLQPKSFRLHMKKNIMNCHLIFYVYCFKTNLSELIKQKNAMMLKHIRLQNVLILSISVMIQCYLQLSAPGIPQRHIFLIKLS